MIKKKLRLDRETIRVLTREKLAAANGGDVGTSDFNTSDLCGRASMATCWFMNGCVVHAP